MDFRFVGDWNPWFGAAVAAALAGFAWWLYRRETRDSGRRLAWLLPLLRTAAVALVVLLLIGPVLHHRRVVGERGRILVFVDASRSMELTDETMEPARKLLAARRLGLLPGEIVDEGLSRAAAALARARRLSTGRSSEGALARGVKEAFGHLSKVRAETGGVALERKGFFLREAWTEIPGDDVRDLTKHADFPARPDRTSHVDLFEAPENFGDKYGTRLRGFVHPPTDGNYVFWISGDDRAELWLSKDADPEKKTLIARVSKRTGSRGWEERGEQKSRPVPLKAGQKVYVEALHKEESDSDSLAVGWQLPGGMMERPIPGSRLSAPSTVVESPARALESMIARFREELLDSAEEMPVLLRTAARWESELRRAFAAYAERLASSDDPEIKEALEAFDGTPRWKRVEALLFSEKDGLIARLAEKHHVELIALSGKEPRAIWGSGGGREDEESRLPGILQVEPDSNVTNLSDGLRARITQKSEERVAVVIFSDGRHNDGSSPLVTSRALGNRKIPVYTVGLGGAVAPGDLAVVDVRAPASVFHKDRLRGEITLKDDMEPGQPFTIRIEHQGKVLWERKRVTEHARLRKVAFDVAIRDVVEELAGRGEEGIEVLSQPIALKARIVPIEGEKEARNNEQDFHVHAIRHRRRLLILDGRPRWETRYVRNLFDRDEQWEVNTLLARQGANAKQWPRGEGPGKFPKDREGLYAYDFIMFGEVPRQYLKMEELEWIRDFVGNRGGGLLVLDGRRGHAGSYVDTPVGDLIPVNFLDAEPLGSRPTALRLTERGAQFAMLQFDSDPKKNGAFWESLRPPHSVVPSRALPGTETLVEAVVGERNIPVLVYRRFGAGRVLYAGFDESWRWRYEVGDRDHSRYWNQVVRAIAEKPFAVRSSRVSLDAGKPVYDQGESVALRARLLDAQGRPLVRAEAEAWVMKEGRRVAAIRLEADENSGGLFHGRTGALPGGAYEVRLKVEGMSDADAAVTTEFTVRAEEAGELTVLNANEELLRQMAAQSDGGYFREEESDGLGERLEPLSRERIFESDTVLWQSWWWFVPLVALFALEWALRKWAGML